MLKILFSFLINFSYQDAVLSDLAEIKKIKLKLVRFSISWFCAQIQPSKNLSILWHKNTKNIKTMETYKTSLVRRCDSFFYCFSLELANGIGRKLCIWVGVYTRMGVAYFLSKNNIYFLSYQNIRFIIISLNKHFNRKIFFKPN